MHFHILVTATVSVFECVTTLRAKIAFDVNAVMFLDFAAQLMRDQVQRLLVHRTVFDGVNCARLDSGPIFQSALEHVDDRRLTAADWSHQQEDTLAYFQTLGSRFEVFDNSGNWFFDAKEFAGKEFVGEYLVLSALVEPLNAGGMNHVVDASV